MNTDRYGVKPIANPGNERGQGQPCIPCCVVKNGAIQADSTKLIAKTSFTQVVEATALPKAQIKSFRQGGDVSKWAQYIRVCSEIDGTVPEAVTWNTQAILIPDVPR